MKILILLRKELVGKKLIDCTDVEFNKDGSLNVDYYNESEQDVPPIGEIITDVGEGDVVDSYPTLRLHFSNNRSYDIFLSDEIEIE